MLKVYTRQMEKYGESYASAFYIIAALVLALSGTGLHKLFDGIAGGFLLACDVVIIALQLSNRAPKFRSFLLFAASFIGSLILLAGGIFDDFHKAVTDIEVLGAWLRLGSNIIQVFASSIGLMTLFPKIKISLPEKPGIYYFVSYGLFLVFALLQFYRHPSFLTSGYILATILWFCASNAIRLKYDEEPKELSKV